MDRVCEELDAVKAELEKLKEECRPKTELSNSLRKAHNEQLIKFQEAKAQIEKQAEELNVRSGEMCELRQLYENLKSSFCEKDTLLGHLNSANEKLRDDYAGRFQKLEGENKELALALDEATSRIQVLESKIHSSNEEIEGLKLLLLNKQKKCLEADQKAMVSKELNQKVDTILKLEEESGKIQDQLKWKNEQFVHLEEAHRRLQDQFRSSKADWERERSVLVEEISLLQTNLDSQTRISEMVQTRLKMCNQALAHEESRRKILEVEASELKSHFENVFVNSYETKSKTEHLTLKRDEEIANLRNFLGTKETLSKEMEHKISHLDQEKQGLNESLEESQNKNAGMNSSLKKHQKKFQDLEQLHKKKEIEWSSQVEKLTGVVDEYKSKLKGKNKQIQELQKDLEDQNCLLEVKNEETFIIMMVLKSEFAAGYSKLFRTKLEMELCNKERGVKILLLTEQLEIKNGVLRSVHEKLDQKCEEVASLAEKVESFGFMEEELKRQKKLLAESSDCQLGLKEQVLPMESQLKMQNCDSSIALEKTNSELTKKISEASQIEVELQKWKSMAENLKVCLEDCQEASKGENERLQVLVKEKDKKIFNLQGDIGLLESRFTANTEEMEILKQEKEHYIRIVEDEHITIENLQNEIVSLKENTILREVESALAREFAQKDFEQEIKLAECDFGNAFVCCIEKEIENDVLSEALEKSGNMKNVEIEDKENINGLLKMEINDLCEKLKRQEESFLHLEKQVEQLEDLLQTNNCEMVKVKNQSACERRQLEDLVKELESQKGALLEDIVKLSRDRDDMPIQVEEFCERLNEFSGKDVELMAILENVLQNFEEEKGQELNLLDSGLNDSIEILKIQFSPSEKETGGSVEERSRLTELNL